MTQAKRPDVGPYFLQTEASLAASFKSEACTAHAELKAKRDDCLNPGVLLCSVMNGNQLPNAYFLD